MLVQEDVHVVREVLEGALPVGLATAVMFMALRDLNEVPKDRDGVLEFCRGPLARALILKVGQDVTDEVLQRIQQVLVRGDWTGTDIPIDVDVDLNDVSEGSLVMNVIFAVPVSVPVVSSKFRFAERLAASLGDERVALSTVMNESELRRAGSSTPPRLVVIDATAAPAIGNHHLARCLQSLAPEALVVVWGDNTAYGSTLLRVLEESGCSGVGIDEGAGIGPILDLVVTGVRRS
jgi:hypothetical protein